jgi:hypothetical protein
MKISVSLKNKYTISFTANGRRIVVPWQRIEPLSAIAIEGHVRNRHRISNVESSGNDEKIVVAVEGSSLTHIRCERRSHIGS